MELQEVLHMNGGEGDTSYAKNSSYNLFLIRVKPILEQCIQELLRANLPNINKCIKVADLGCASGPNTLLTVRDIVQSIDKVGQEKKNELERPTIQIFLNDLFQNDFNSVFKSLPSFFRKLEKENGRKIGSCLIGAMPGSFYGRLFPEESMHFLHSCYCLHWLSQVPSGLVTELGISANKGCIYSSKASRPPIQKAYLDQFTKDFTTFLRIHSEELISRGRMLLTWICKEDEFENPNSIDLLEMSINDLVIEGHLEEEKLDSFNVPIYAPSTEEVKCIVEEKVLLKFYTWRLLRSLMMLASLLMMITKEDPIPQYPAMNMLEQRMWHLSLDQFSNPSSQVILEKLSCLTYPTGLRRMQQRFFAPAKASMIVLSFLSPKSQRSQTCKSFCF